MPEHDEDSLWFAFLSPERRAEHYARQTRDLVSSMNRRSSQQAAADNFRAAEMAVRSGRDEREDQQRDEIIELLERRVASLALYSRTILQILVDKGIVSSDEFASRMRELDLLDGTLDGR